MKAETGLIAVIMLVIGTVGVFPAGAVAAGSDTVTVAQAAPDQPTNETNTTNETSVGAKMMGVVGMEHASINGEVEEREFEIEMNESNTTNESVEVVSEEVDEIKERLDDLKERKKELREEYKNDNISKDQYKAEMAKLHVQKKQLTKLLNDTRDAAEGMPEEKLRANGVNVTAIKTLKQNASNLTGPEVAQIARKIGGPPEDVPGRGPPGERPGNNENETDAPGRSGERGPPGNERGSDDGAENDTKDVDARLNEAEEDVAEAQKVINETENEVDSSNESAVKSLERAKEDLTAAEKALEQARTAHEDGKLDRARKLAEDAIEAAENATEHAENASESGEKDRSNRQRGGQ